MQDPYAAIMGAQQRDPFKAYSTPNRGNGSSIPPNTSSTSSYYGLPYGSSFTNHPPDSYQQSMAMASGMAQEFTPLPAHIGSPNALNHGNNGLSRINPTTHTITHTQTSPPSGAGMGNLSDLSSPMPSSSSRMSMSPEGQSQSQMSSPSPSDSISVKREHNSNSSDSEKRDNTDDDSSGIPPKKRLHTVPSDQRDNIYWEKRKKNNESAKRSREARRMKEEQIALRVVYLEQENLQLRTEVSLLKSEIEKLRCMLYNS